MPPVAKCDHDGIEIWPRQKFADVAVRRAVARAVVSIHHGFRRASMGLLDVAHGEDLNVRLLQEPAQHVTAPTADADRAHPYALRGRDRAVAPEGAGGDDPWRTRERGETPYRGTTREGLRNVHLRWAVR